MRGLGTIFNISSIFALLLMGVIVNGFSQNKALESERSVNALLGKVAQELERKHNMRVSGTTVAMPRSDIRCLGLDFHIRGPLTKAHIRAVLLDCAGVFLAHVNEDEKVRPYLNHYPFGVGDLDINLFIDDDTPSGPMDPQIGIAGIVKGKLDYCTLQERNEIPSIKSKEIESYAEALDAMKREAEGPA